MSSFRGIAWLAIAFVLPMAAGCAGREAALAPAPTTSANLERATAPLGPPATRGEDTAAVVTPSAVGALPTRLRSDDQLADLIADALPGVVLLVNFRDDGSLRFGAGVLLDKDTILTNLHVVDGAKSLGAMLYDPRRTTYSPLDGGLNRYLFEYQRELRAVRLARADAVLDLAVVTIERAAPPSAKPLALGGELPRPGDRVIALGHPGEALWSSTVGIVSAIHHGVIQHDAPVSPGNSGGPLLDTRGEVVGINTNKLRGEASNVSFARPASYASNLANQAEQKSAALDLSTPESAALSCLRAFELGTPNVLECFDWDQCYERTMSMARERFAALPEEQRRRKQLSWKTLEDKANFVAFSQRGLMAMIDVEDDASATLTDYLRGLAASPPAEWNVEVKVEPSTVDDPTWLEQYGAKVDLCDMKRMREVLKNGVRVAAVEPREDDVAWVQIEGRNPDGTIYQFSQMRAKRAGSWLELMTHDDPFLGEPPKGWPRELPGCGVLRVDLGRVIEHAAPPIQP